MPSTVQVNSGWLIGFVIALVFVLLYPIVVATITHLRLHVSWRFFGFGALIFLLFQLITRVPLVTWLQSLLEPQLRGSQALLIGWAFLLALTAGLCEEIGRYVGYRWLVKRANWNWRVGVMYGLGHGGLECTVLIGGTMLLSLLNLLIIPTLNLNTLPYSQHVQIVHQFAEINAQPAWTSLLGAWERLWTLPFHVAMSIVVLQVFRRRNIRWLFLAILIHTLFDFVTALLPIVLGSHFSTTLIVEGVVALVGLAALWIIWRLRDDPAGVPAVDLQTARPDVSDASLR